MTMTAASPGSRWTPWLARLSFALAAAAVAVVAVAAGLRSFGMLAVGLAAAAVSLAAAYWFLSRRGALRWLSLAVFVAAPIAVIVVYALHSLLWVALARGRGVAARGRDRPRGAGRRPRGRGGCPSTRCPGPPVRPFLIMNPKSGDGKVGRFDLRRQGRGPWRRGVPARR